MISRLLNFRSGAEITKLGLPLALALIFSSCAAWKPFPFKQPLIQELPEKYKTYYDYPVNTQAGNIVSEQKIKHYILKRVEIPLSLPSEIDLKNKEAFIAETEEILKTDKKTGNDRSLRYLNRIDLYMPKNLKPGEKRPVILVSPILGGNMVVDRFAAYYAGRGYIAALVHRKKLFWDDEEDIEQIEKYMRTSVIRLRQAVDWLEKMPEADSNRIAGFGVSYGAILHSVLAAVEPRVKYHVLAMPAAPIPDVIVECPDAMITKLMKSVHQKYGWSKEKIHEDLKRTLLTDPIQLAPYINRKKVTYYVALFDRVVGAERSFKLWKAMGKPNLKVMPFGHYGGVLVFPYLQTQSYQAFKRHFRTLQN